VHSLGDRFHGCGCFAQASLQFGHGDELDLFIDKIETGFQVGQQVEQTVAQQVQWFSNPAGQLR
jgi:hypothetical protein